MTDYHRLISGLVPKLDGESAIRHRTALVDVQNADGTLDLDFNGTIVPDVSVLDGVWANVGDVVQVIAWAGDLLVLGRHQNIQDGATLRYFQADTTGGPTSGTTVLTLATVNVPAFPWAYNLDAAMHWPALLNTAGDQFVVRIRVDGVDIEADHFRPGSTGGPNLRYTFSIPAISLVTIPANTASQVLVRTARVSGTGTATTEENGLLTVKVLPT